MLFDLKYFVTHLLFASWGCIRLEPEENQVEDGHGDVWTVTTPGVRGTFIPATEIHGIKLLRIVDNY